MIYVAETLHQVNVNLLVKRFDTPLQTPFKRTGVQAHAKSGRNGFTHDHDATAVKEAALQVRAPWLIGREVCLCGGNRHAAHQHGQ